MYGSYITHRITEQTPEGYKTCGDSPLSLPDPWTVQPEDIVAVYEKNLPLMTALGRLFSTPMGMVLVFALFFAVCGFVFIPAVVKTLRERGDQIPVLLLTAKQSFEDKRDGRGIPSPGGPGGAPPGGAGTYPGGKPGKRGGRSGR